MADRAVFFVVCRTEMREMADRMCQELETQTGFERTNIECVHQPSDVCLLQGTGLRLLRVIIFEYNFGSITNSNDILRSG